MQNLGDLKTTIADWINREDLTAVIPLCIRLAEGQIYRNLRCQDNEFIATYNNLGWNIDGHPVDAVSDGIFTALPSNFAEMRLVKWNDCPLQHISDQQLARRIATGADTGTVRAFSIVGRKIEFTDLIDTDPNDWGDGDSLVFVYYGTESINDLPIWQVPTNPVESPPIPDEAPVDMTQVDTNTTRMFIANPDAYLQGSLFHLCQYVKDREGRDHWGSMFNQTLEDLRVESMLGMVSGSTSQVSSVE